MEYREVYGLFDHWRDTPPTHLAVARVERVILAALGVDTREDEAPLNIDPTDPFGEQNAWAKRANARQANTDEAAIRELVAQANGGWRS